MASHGERLAVVLAEDLYENLELHYPRLRLLEAGFRVVVAGPERGARYASKEGYPVQADVSFSDVNPGDVTVLVVPGGYAPDRLRRHDACIALVAAVWQAGGVVAAICHGGWVPASAGIVRGRRITSFFSIRDDMENAGASWVDQPCLRDGRLVSAQTPRDLPDFMRAIFEAAASLGKEAS